MLDDSNSYFMVPHSFKAYLEEWPAGQNIPSEHELEGLQSIGLKLLSEVKGIESSCLLQLRKLEGDSKAVIDYLKLQSKKIDLILQYVLESEHQDGRQVAGYKFGGDGIEVISNAAAEVNSLFKTTLFIRNELIAILAITEVKDCQQHPEYSDRYLLKLEFSQILEADVELLIQASLSVQQKLLKARNNRQ
ncbi:hypothetical protein D5018_10640 [Parashewanella curva]|uniref:PilZ domain-containing protein n=1 Tax=Parashewanella curva TaxID=2338552 RepID=A0A3L8PWL5_9GAMM|nr:hypothetical protein [Parashewanella curva]RLV59710.1 hypothetical protein D5018_10640 [Parashewanella curva]